MDSGIVGSSPPRIRRLTVWWLAAVLLVSAGVVVLLLGWRWRSDVAGRFASYALFPHDPSDTLEFSAGSVRLRTCCGDEDWGTYETRDGAVVWHLMRKGQRQATAVTIVLHPFSATFTDARGTRLVLRRKISKRWWL